MPGKIMLSVLLLGIGFLLMPVHAHACSSKMPNKAMNKTVTACCKAGHHKNGHRCGGNCQDPACHCINHQVSNALFVYSSAFDRMAPEANVAPGLSFINAQLLAGFASTWLLPKIS